MEQVYQDNKGVDWSVSREHLPKPGPKPPGEASSHECRHNMQTHRSEMGVCRICTTLLTPTALLVPATLARLGGETSRSKHLIVCQRKFPEVVVKQVPRVLEVVAIMRFFFDTQPTFPLGTTFDTGWQVIRELQRLRCDSGLQWIEAGCSAVPFGIDIRT
eukprot:1614528-Amphidinium_carterae.1